MSQGATAIGILGGTFDPVHIGHLILAEQALQAFGLAKVVFLPTGKPARKLATTVATPQQRTQMLQLACADNPQFELNTLEVARDGVTYTVDTIKQLRAHYGAQAQLYFILGADSICDLPSWKSADILAQELVFLGATRNGYDAQHCVDEAVSKGFKVKMFAMPVIDISSELVRATLALGQSIRYMVPDAVISYINEQGLYA